MLEEEINDKKITKGFYIRFYLLSFILIYFTIEPYKNLAVKVPVKIN